MAERELKTRITASDETKGPIDSATASFEGLKRRVEDMNKPLEAIKGLFVGIAATVVGEFVKSTVEAAASSEQSWARVRASLENAGIGARHVHGELDALFESMSKTSRFSEKDLAGAFATLLNVTNDYQGSVANLGLAANISVARQMDLSQAAELVGRVMDGNTSMLKRYGIVLRDDGVAPMDQLRERFQHFAEEDANSLSGSLAKIGNDFEKLKEAIGDALMGDGTRGGLAGFDASLRDLGEWVKTHKGDITDLTDAFLGLGKAIGATAGGLVKFGYWSLGESGLRDRANAAFSPIEPNTTNMMQETFQRQAEIEANARRVAAQKAADAAKAELAEIQKQIAEMEGGVAVPLDVQHSLELWKKQGFDPTAHPGVTAQISGLQAKGQEQNRISGILLDAQAKGSPVQKVGDVFSVDLPKAIDVAQSSVTTFFSAWSGLVDVMIQHHGKLGAAIVATGKAAIGQVIGAQGQAAILKAGEAAAEGLFPPNPALLAKAAELLAIGTAEIALGSALGGGGGGGGGGSYGAGSGGWASGGGAATSASSGPAKVVNITLRGASYRSIMRDPEAKADFIGLLQDAYGDATLNFMLQG